MNKNLRSIQFLHNQVIIEMGQQGRTFHLCERCDSQGQHLQEFLQFFVPTLDYSPLKPQSMRFLERQSFYALANKSRNHIKWELHELVREIEARLNQTPSPIK